ncbi:MAG: uroporphyrinogen-III synthase [Bdellovibrionales bacterium]|nr:uroporphyrinogen-III synthase [Bdellovibrionales bacterium]
MGKKFPLEDKHIILTQTEMQIKKFEKHLIVEKAVPLAMPCIEPKIILSDKEMNDSFSNLGQYDWVIFTSQNAFLLLYEYLKKIHKQDQLHKIKIASIGHETKETIQEEGFSIAFTPEIPKTSKEFFDQWMENVNLRGKKILFPRSKRSVSQVPDNLIDLGALIIPIEFYDVLQHDHLSKYFESLVTLDIDWVVFSSPTAVNAFFSMRSNDEEVRHWIFSTGVKIITIGPTTTQALSEKRVPVSCESPKPSARWMVETMKAFEKLENWDYSEDEEENDDEE